MLAAYAGSLRVLQLGISSPSRIVCAEIVRERDAAIGLARSELVTANADVMELRTQLAALSSELRGELSAKIAEAQQMQGCNAALAAQLEEVQAARLQAEGHAGVAVVMHDAGAGSPAVWFEAALLACLPTFSVAA